MRSSHGPSAQSVTFDDTHAVAHAGLALVGTLSEHLGVEAVVDEHVDLSGRPGYFRPGRKVATLVHAMVAGADCIDDGDLLRSGATGAVLAHGVMAPSTLGTFLRSFTFGHVRQLDRVTEELLRRAWQVGAGPGDGPMTIDIDSTICEVCGYKKQGATFGYTKVRGLHPLLATRADTGGVLHLRMRKGSANTGRGAERFVREVIDRVRGTGATGPLTLRADSGFCSKHVVTACRDHGVGYLITVNQNKWVKKAIEAIDEEPGRTSTPTWAGSPRWPRPPMATATASSCGARRSSRPRASCSSTGATTPSSPTGWAPPSPSTPTTGPTPWSSSPSGT